MTRPAGTSPGGLESRTVTFTALAAPMFVTWIPAMNGDGRISGAAAKTLATLSCVVGRPLAGDGSSTVVAVEPTPANAARVATSASNPAHAQAASNAMARRIRTPRYS